MKSCASCNTVKFDDGQPCPVCAAVPAGAHCGVTTCVVCRKMMPAEAWRCSSCSTYKNWPRLPILTTIASICGGTIAVASAVISIYWFIHLYSSHTYLKVGRSRQSAIFVKFWNTGRNPSTISGCRLVFDALPGKQATLDLIPSDSADAKSVIANGPPVVIGLTRARMDELPPAVRKTELQHDDLAALPGWPAAQQLTLVVNVQESSDTPGTYHVLEEKLVSKPIASFLASNYGFAEVPDADQ
jgi:hypothetical protein